jgi:hypothetical protein
VAVRSAPTDKIILALKWLRRRLSMKVGLTIKLSLLQVIILCLFLTIPVFAVDLHFQAETILRTFERDVREDGQDKKKTVVPFYAYLQMDAEKLYRENLSFHAYGWGRQDFADSGFFDNDTEGEFLYGYLQYIGSANNLLLRLGRQYVFEFALNDSVDGLLAKADFSPYFSFLVFGGKSVSLDDATDGNSFTTGGRIEHHQGNLYEIGLFYRYLGDDGNRNQEEVGLDLSFLLPRNISVLGYSKWNLITNGWAEHSYEAHLDLSGVQLRPFFDYFDYENLMAKKKDSVNPFTFLAQTGEKYAALGLDLTYPLTPAIDLGAKLKHYDYNKIQNTSQYYSGLVVCRWGKSSEAGVELGYLDGDTSNSSYFLGRTYVYEVLSPGFVTADLVYAHYDEAVEGDDQSLFISLGTGKNFLDDTLEVRLSGDFTSGPYFDSDLRGMIKLRYNFKHSFSSKEP